MAKGNPRKAASAARGKPRARPAAAGAVAVEPPPPVVMVEPGPTVAWRRQIIFWVAAAAIFIAFLYVFSSILLPFLAGMVLAYFLDPVADRLQRLGFSRLAATIVILVGFLLVLTLALMVIIPALSNQLVEFAARLPDYLSRLQALITRLDPGFLEDTVGVDSRTLQEGLNTLLAQGTGFVATLFRSVWSSGLALLNLASLFVVTPVVAFYMLLDWDNMV